MSHCTHSIFRECVGCQVARETSEVREALEDAAAALAGGTTKLVEYVEDPEEIAPCLLCGEPKPNRSACDCWPSDPNPSDPLPPTAGHGRQNR